MSRAQLLERRRERGRRGRTAGRAAEIVALLLMMIKGYQILAFRLRTRDGEIDILARRGGILAVVEVKQRPTLDEAMAALGPEQTRRLLDAGLSLQATRPGLRQLALRLQLIALAPGRFPRHVSNLFDG